MNTTGIYTDRTAGIKVQTVSDDTHSGCRMCAYATRGGGACCGAEYDRHPCMAQDREDGQEVFFLLVERTGVRRAVRGDLFVFPAKFKVRFNGNTN